MVQVKSLHYYYTSRGFILPGKGERWKQRTTEYQKVIVPDKVNINWSHCASENYSVSSLGIINSLAQEVKGWNEISTCTSTKDFSLNLVNSELPHQGLELLEWFHAEL